MVAIRIAWESGSSHPTDTPVSVYLANPKHFGSIPGVVAIDRHQSAVANIGAISRDLALLRKRTLPRRFGCSNRHMRVP